MKAKRKKVLSFLLILSLFGNTGGLVADEKSISQDMSVLTNLLSDLNQAANLNNYSKMAKLLGNAWIKDVKRTLGRKSVTSIQKESMLTLMLKSKSIVVTPVIYENDLYRKYGNGYTVFFIVSESVSEVMAGKKVWLQDYVACDFFVQGRNVSNGPTLCYDETEGPFPIKYDNK